MFAKSVRVLTHDDLDDPFVMEGEEMFADALLIQCVSDPSRLILVGKEEEKPRGGFFIESEGKDAPVPGFQPAFLLTRDGRRVRGFGGRELAFYPVAHRFRWEAGEPEARRPLKDYQEGARGHVQLLVVLLNGAWAVVTARGLASRDLLRAFEAHRHRVARTLRSADRRPYGPFAARLELAAGEPYRKGATVVTPFVAVAGTMNRAPVEIGRAVRARWDEIQAWVMAWTSNGNENGEEEMPGPRPEALEPAADLPPASPTAVPEPEPAPAPAPTPEETRAEEAGEPVEAPVASGPDLDVQAALAFLVGKAGAIALDRIAAVLGERPADAGEAARALAARKADASFWGDVSGALDRFLGWVERVPVLRRRAPVRYRALKEDIRLGPAFRVDTDDPEALAAVAALSWLFRPGLRARIEALLRPDPDEGR